MTKEINNSNEEKTLQERRAYSTPKLQCYGGLAELTQARHHPGNDAPGAGLTRS